MVETGASCSVGHSRRGYVSVLATLFVAAAILLASSSPASAAELSETPFDNVQIDGRVSDTLLVGNRLYIAGNFLNVNGVSRTRLAAIDVSTGALTSWAPRANQWVMTLAASPDGGHIYAGGAFGSVNGVSRGRLVKLDAVTGAVDGAWRPAANDSVRSLAVSGDRVYTGGLFTAVNGVDRARLAAIDANTGTLVPDWAPSANDVVRVLEFSPDGSRVYVGGFYSAISGQARRGLAALDPMTGAVAAWRPASTGRPVLDLTATNAHVFTAEAGAGGKAAAYDAATGAILWSLYGDGDVQAVALMDGKVYLGGHFEVFGDQPRVYFAAADPITGALDPLWSPTGRTGGGVWTFAADPARTRLYAGGDFTHINGRPKQRFAEFAQ